MEGGVAGGWVYVGGAGNGRVQKYPVRGGDDLGRGARVVGKRDI